MKNTYLSKNIKEASDKNWELILKVFSKGGAKIFDRPPDKFPVDGIVSWNNESGEYTALILATVREISGRTLREKYDSRFIIEKKKFDRCKKFIKDCGIQNGKIFYLCRVENTVWVFDLTNRKMDWEEQYLVSSTYDKQHKYIKKSVDYIPTVQNCHIVNL